MRYISRITFAAPNEMRGFKNALMRATRLANELVTRQQRVDMQIGNKPYNGIWLDSQKAQYGRIIINDIPTTEQLNAVSRMVVLQLMHDGIQQGNIRIERKEKPKPQIITPNVVRFKTIVRGSQ